MIEQLEFKINNTDIVACELTQVSIILCENVKLVDIWKNILRDIKSDKEDVLVGFKGFAPDNIPYKTDEDYDEFLNNLIIDEIDNGIRFTFPNGYIQNFYINNNISIVQFANSYYDIWFCKEDAFYALTEFEGIKAKYEYNFDKDYLSRDILCGRFGCDVENELKKEDEAK
jgi:hypothetical protein